MTESFSNMRVYISHTNTAGKDFKWLAEMTIEALNVLLDQLHENKKRPTIPFEYVHAYLGGKYDIKAEDYDILIFIPNEESISMGTGVLKEMSKSLQLGIPALVYYHSTFHRLKSVYNNGSADLSANLTMELEEMNARLSIKQPPELPQQVNADII